MNTAPHQQIAFVLDNVADNQTLVAGIPSGTQVYVLESSGDVLAQMAAITSGYSNLDAIHLYSHGSDGALDLGSLSLESSNLNDHASILSQIGTSLSQNGDILLYGCNVAQGQSGVEFISKLSQATGADIAASEDLSGASDKGGDWVLEAHTGSVEAQAISANEFEWVLAPSGSPVYDFEGLSTQVDTNEVTFAANDHTLDTSSSNGTVTNMGHYLSANTSATGTIHLHFTDGATFDASSIKLEKFSDEDNVNLMITSNLTNRASLDYTSDNLSNQEMYIWNGALSASSFATINLSMFQGATDLYIEGWSGGAISGMYIDDFTVDFPVVNAAPVITNLNGDSVSIAPGEVGMIDADQMPNNAWVTDSDSANFNNGYLLISQATGTPDGNFSAIDSVVLFNASGAGLDGNSTPISASGTPAHGNDVYVMTMDGWVMIGTVDQLDGQNGSDLRIYLNASATPNCISTILETLQYSSATLGTRTFEATVNDGIDTSSAATFTVVVGAATAPEITVHLFMSDIADGGVSTFDDTDVGGTPGMIRYSIINDGDADLNISAITITGDSEFTLGALTVNNIETTVIAMGEEARVEVYFTPTAGGIRTAEISIASDDSDENPFNISIDGLGVVYVAENTAPENTISATYTTNEDTTLSITDLAVADAEMDTLTVILSVNHGTINMSNINTATNITAIDVDGLDGSISFSGMADDINLMLADGVDFYPLSNANGDGAATLTMTTSDGTATDTDTATINITAINDAPTFNIHNGDFSTSFIGADTDGDYNSDNYASCNASALLPDGSIINVGDATFMGTPYVALTKLNSDGTPNADFGRGGFKVFDGGSVFGIGGSATSVAVQPDGKIVMSGSNGEGYVFLAILNSDGSSDSIINVADDLSGSNNALDTDSLYLDYIALQADGKIVLAGGQNPAQDSGFNADGGDVVLARYNADGTVDTSFGTNGTVVTNLGNADGCAGITIDASGAILLAVDGGNNGDMGVAKYDATGALDTSFGTSGIAWSSVAGEFNEATAGAIQIQSDGKIVLAGSVQGIDDSDIALARFNANGTLDTTFSVDGKTIFGTADTEMLRNSGGNDYAHSLGIDANGNLYVGGEFGFNGDGAEGYTGSASFESVAKFDAAGTLDTSFAQGGMVIPEYVQEGYIVVDAQAQDAYSNDYWDSNNDPHGDSGSINSVLIQPDGKIVLGGSYSNIDIWNGDYVSDYSDMIDYRMDANGNLDTHNFGYTADTVNDSDTDAFTEGGDAVTIGVSEWSYFTPSVYDVEQHAADNYSGGTLSIHRAGGADSEDLIRFDTSGTSAMTVAGITLEGTSATTGNIKHNGSTFATFDTNPSHNEASTDGRLVIHFTSSQTAATQALVDAVTASISYDNTNDLNPGLADGEVELSWFYNDGDEQESTSSCFIKIEGTDDGEIEGTVSVSGSVTTGTTLTITGLDTVADPDLVTVENPEGTVPEDDLTYQWQAYNTETQEWNNIEDEAWSSTFVVTEALSGKQIRVVVGYEDRTNGVYSEISSSPGTSGGGNDDDETPAPAPTPTTPTIIDDDNLTDVVKTAPHTETVGNTTVTTQTATATRSFTDDEGHTITQTNKTVEAVEITAPTGSSSSTTAVPLYWGESTQTEWATTASVSSGVTLASEGNRAPATTQTTTSAIDDLIYYIQTTVPSTDSTKTEMLEGGSSFLSALSNVNTLVVNKVVLSTTTSASSTTPASVSLDGTAAAVTTNGVTDTPKEALVIDGTSLSSGSTVSLSNIEFGVLTGANLNVVMTGTATQTVFTGSGTQTLTTSSSTQNQLYAGAGNDIFHITGVMESGLSAPRAEAVNSLSTADTFADAIVNKTALHGEEGDDAASTEGAGTQNVFVHGGSGSDSISYQGSINDYTITRDEGITYVHSNTTSKTDVLLNVESIQFGDGTYTVTNNQDLTQIASLYQQVLGRQAEVDGFQYWAHSYNAGESIGSIATNFVRSSEYFNNTNNAWDSMSNDAKIEVFYQLMLGRASDAEGKAYWMNAINNGNLTIEQIAGDFVVSAEMQGISTGQQAWNFTVA